MQTDLGGAGSPETDASDSLQPPPKKMLVGVPGALSPATAHSSMMPGIAGNSQHSCCFPSRMSPDTQNFPQVS